jgi:hypothetical protein
VSTDPYRSSEPLPATGPADCRACLHGRERPLDCRLVPNDARFRSILVLHSRWKAEDDGCSGFVARPALTLRERLASFIKRLGRRLGRSLGR